MTLNEIRQQLKTIRLYYTSNIRIYYCQHSVRGAPVRAISAKYICKPFACNVYIVNLRRVNVNSNLCGKISLLRLFLLYKYIYVI